VHDYYGGAYGREIIAGRDVTQRCVEVTGIAVDPTYGAKALAAAVKLAREHGGVTLFWLSFDGRWLSAGVGERDSVALR
jgi:1-aminocyclopropane-1-carboxylate deaminase/D-cysteine desulfhydrase-like pyridoxal-dependent ACC family enzyme